MDANKPAGQGHGVAAEPDYVSARLVVGFGVLFAVIAAVSAALMAALFWGYDRKAERRDEVVEAAAGLELREPGLPPLPRLQVYPVRHWKDFQAAERERLDSYGWMDRSSGAVHVPIDRAIELIVERGVGPLPAAPMAVPGAAPAPVEVKK
jgi:hypothetical protein